MERIEITLSGDLPDVGKYATLAAAQEMVDKVATDLNAAHGLALVVSVKAIRPSARKAAPVVALRPGNAA